jgi:hypothetical protein
MSMWPVTGVQSQNTREGRRSVWRLDALILSERVQGDS